ncbi:MAG: iron-sulfur cluster carrier protein ApbC [Chloroflexota bacterium]|nr:MAG: iron-sulfur cluster carrier protein ApbC [Chloroflexota bacterium]
MSSANVDTILAALSRVIEPELHRDLVSLNMVRDIVVEGDAVRLTLMLTTPACPLKSEMKRSVEQAVLAVPGIKRVSVDLKSQVPTAKPVSAELLPGVRHTIAVASNKGGVGKSTVSVNLAVALSESGARVGLLDADITGPNVPMMLGTRGTPTMVGDKMGPVEAHGVKVMSIGFFLPAENKPIIWRGPLIAGAIKQFLGDVLWGELDYLVIDLPPGTSDASLSLTQLIPLSGVVIVSTPQEVALSDVAKSLGMFKSLNVPVLGLVENMSYFVCPHCGDRTDVFSHGGGQRAAESWGIPFLGEIPLDPLIRVGGDAGRPIVVDNPESPQSAAFRQLAGAVASKISVAAFEEARSVAR